MSIIHLVFCCLTIYHASAGRIVKGIVGRNVSFSWTINTVRSDAILIMHGESIFHQILPISNNSIRPKPLDRNRVSVSYAMPEKVKITVEFMNITKNDSGMYSVVLQWNSTELDQSVHLQTFAEPKIEIIHRNILDSSLTLECSLSSISADTIIWTLNGSLIKYHHRYSAEDKFLFIKNLTVDDGYNVLQCKDLGGDLESDMYSIQMSGPKCIKFLPNIEMVQEHSVVNVTCIADCYPICSWTWTKFDPTSGRDDFISAENSLFIQDITRHDAGTYVCKVVNTITCVSLTNFTSLKIIYGPDSIVFNPSGKIVKLDETDSITISCSADCNPPCQIGWNKYDVESQIPSQELNIDNVKRDSNYTCHATNPGKYNSKISDTIYIIKKSETNDYITTSMNIEQNPEDFQSQLHLRYILLGMGVILAAAFLVYLMYKIRICVRVARLSNTNRCIDSTEHNEEENLPEVKQYGNYWTIVSNAIGEMSTAIDSNFEWPRGLPQTEQNISFHTQYEAEHAARTDAVNAFEELDGYITPIHSHQAQLDMYIHPSPTQYEAEHSMSNDDDNVENERDGYLTPIHSRNAEHDDYISPIHSDPMQTDVLYTSQSREY